MPSDHFYDDPNCFEDQFGGEKENELENFGINVITPIDPDIREPNEEEVYEILHCLQEEWY